MGRVSGLTARLDTEVDGNEFVLLADTDAVYNTVTASTISASTVDDSFSDSANGLGGYKIGTTISVSGFATGGLNTTYTVATVASDGSKITVEETLSASEAAGSSITIDGLGLSYKMLLSELKQYVSGTPSYSVETASKTGSVTADFVTYTDFVWTLTGNITLDNPTTESAGQRGHFVFIQDGTGSRTVTLGTDYESKDGGGITLTTTAGATDIVPYFVAASGRILLGVPTLNFS